MKFTLKAFLLVALASATFSSAFAVSGNFTNTAGGLWNTPTNWSSNPTVPGTTAGDAVNLNPDFTSGGKTITLNTNAIVGTMIYGDSNATSPSALTFTSTAGSTLTFNNSGAGATLTIQGSTSNAFNANVLLADNVTIAGTSFTLSGTWGSSTAGLKTISIGSTTNFLSASVIQDGVSGTVAINKTAGSLTLSGSNSFSGGVTSTAGTIVLNNANALGTGTFTAGGTVNATSGLTFANNMTLAGNITAGSGDITWNGTITNNGGNNGITRVGATNVNGNVYLSESSGVGRTITFNTTGTIAGVISNYNGVGGTAGNVTYQSALGNTVSGTNNSYTGFTSIASVVNVTKLADGGINSSIGASDSTSTNLVMSGGTLRYVGSGDSTNRNVRFNNSSTIDSSGSGALVWTATAAPTVNSSFKSLTLSGTNADNNTLAWTLNGSASSGVNSVTKTGSGKWILTGSNTYASTTTVSAGTLLVNGSHTGGGNYSVTGVLGGSGTIALASAASTTVNSGGSIAPGGVLLQTGTLTFNGTTQAGAVATFATDATFTFDLNATSVTGDRIALINGAANDFVFNNNVINFTVTGALVDGQSYTLFSSNVANAYSGLTFDGSNYVTAGLSFSGLTGSFQTDSKIQLVGNDLVLQAIPEPGTWALVTIGAMATLFLRRRRAS